MLTGTRSSAVGHASLLLCTCSPSTWMPSPPPYLGRPSSFFTLGGHRPFKETTRDSTLFPDRGREAPFL